ncbi:hypothetical protein CRG98_003786 [Punica granatum]|uniref:Uncharacterized protein n=1 Tax=Punica granatum TaxID=22663 RepID=A0A2I0L576_PUNGR|nr:hypothetical protein CRG98_003786 [Punica granatum]
MHGHIALLIVGCTGACPTGFARCTGTYPLCCLGGHVLTCGKFAGNRGLVLRDSNSGEKRLHTLLVKGSESVVVLAACSTCDPDITSKSCKKYYYKIGAVQVGPVLGGLDSRPPGTPASHAWAYRDFSDDALVVPNYLDSVLSCPLCFKKLAKANGSKDSIPECIVFYLRRGVVSAAPLFVKEISGRGCPGACCGRGLVLTQMIGSVPTSLAGVTHYGDLGANFNQGDPSCSSLGNAHRRWMMFEVVSVRVLNANAPVFIGDVTRGGRLVQSSPLDRLMSSMSTEMVALMTYGLLSCFYL